MEVGTLWTDGVIENVGDTKKESHRQQVLSSGEKREEKKTNIYKGKEQNDMENSSPQLIKLRGSQWHLFPSYIFFFFFVFNNKRMKYVAPS